MFGKIGAQERTRTSTSLPILAPEASASTIPPPGQVRRQGDLWGSGAAVNVKRVRMIPIV